LGADPVGKRLSPDALARVHLVAPEEVGNYLDTLPPPEAAVETVGGYQVKVSYRPPACGEAASRTKAVAGVVARS
jgi:hypothetical protein